MPMQIEVRAESFPLASVFTISRGSRTEAHVVTVRISRNGVHGQGECVPYSRYGESIESVVRQIESLPSKFSRMELQELLPPGAARNAVDCALWDLESKESGRRVWELARLPAPLPVTTAYTLSLEDPDRMKASAARQSHRPLLKIKLGTPDDIPRLEAVREASPESAIIVDANEGWNRESYLEMIPHLVRLGVKMVEQPLPAGNDAPLEEMERPVPVCADESCHDRSTLPELKGRYDMINIKLDKTGGLTEALALKKAALQEGFGLMVGCMVGTSLAMAPALLVAQEADVVDLDGPLLLAGDREKPLLYEESLVHPPDTELWG